MLRVSLSLSLRTSMHVLLLLLARLSCTCTNQGSQGSSSTSWMHPFYRRPQNTQAMRFFLGEGRRDHYLHASPSPKMRSSNRFANIIPIQSAERRTRDAHTRGFPSSERAGRLYFLFFFFYFYANGVFFFSRDGAVTQEREKKKRRRNIRLVFRLRSFNRRWISYLEQGFVRIIENTFRFIVSLKCTNANFPSSRFPEPGKNRRFLFHLLNGGFAISVL